MDALGAITTIVNDIHKMNAETRLAYIHRISNGENPNTVISEWRMAENELDEDRLYQPLREFHDLDTLASL